MDLEILESSCQGFTSNIPGESRPLSHEELAEFVQALEQARERMGHLYVTHQYLGRQAAIGCVALEITQRCNLDCTLCYLSENSEHVKDIPLQEIFRRLEGIRKHFGVGTVVQITGGDPTLRERKELIVIVRRTRELGLHPALFTNGIKASRKLLIELAEAGLNDVAFHVDLTQQRKGFKTEKELNAIREEYIERGRGLPINVIFNTTVHKENFSEIPDLVRFFIKHADVVSMASFQLQADTGRGLLRKREVIISLESVREKINEGAGTRLPWDTILIGHPQCHKYAMTLEANGHLYPVVDDQELYGDFLRDFCHVMIDRRASRKEIIWQYLKAACRKPIWYWRGLKYSLSRLWNMKNDLLAARGQVNKLSFFIQNFMDADSLDPERINACSFMVMTDDGPISMCAHNARRDEFILKPLEIETGQGKVTWIPLRETTTPRKAARQKPFHDPAITFASFSEGCRRCGA
ncbi:MAG: radical SAM protein [Candidatus Tectomicrobia bacterium]|nr:radical SAM protein [Candidatus Tectomicrobia bacterium]